MCGTHRNPLFPSGETLPGAAQRPTPYDDDDAFSSCNSDSEYSIVDSLAGLESLLSFHSYDRLGEGQGVPGGRTSSSPLPVEVGALPLSTSVEEGTMMRAGAYPDAAAAQVGVHSDAAAAAGSSSTERTSSGSASASSTNAAMRMAQAELKQLRRLVEERRVCVS